MEINVELGWKSVSTLHKVVWQQFIGEAGTFFNLPISSFFRTSCTKNYQNWFIFHGFIQK